MIRTKSCSNFLNRILTRGGQTFLLIGTHNFKNFGFKNLTKGLDLRKWIECSVDLPHVRKIKYIMENVDNMCFNIFEKGRKALQQNIYL